MSKIKNIKEKSLYFDDDVCDKLIKRIESRTEKEKVENEEIIEKSLNSDKLIKLNFSEIQNILLSDLNYKKIQLYNSLKFN